MIEIRKKTNVDITFFISDNEKLSKITALFLGLAQKNYLINDTPIPFFDKQFNGVLARFDRVDLSQSRGRSVSHLLVNRKNSSGETKLALKYDSRLKNHSKAGSILFEISPILNFSEIMSRLGNDNTLSLSNPIIEAKIDIHGVLFSPPEIQQAKKIIMKNGEKTEKISDIDELEENGLDDCINKILFFENNYNDVMPLFVIPQISDSLLHKVPVSIRSFSKLKKYINPIRNLEIPSRETKRKFLDLCSVFKNNRVVNKVQANNFTFTKPMDGKDASVQVDFIGIPILVESTLGRYIYLDHPSVNFAAGLIENMGLFDSIEAKISKEIITRI